jgi:hypothetical protein
VPVIVVAAVAAALPEYWREGMCSGGGGGMELRERVGGLACGGEGRRGSRDMLREGGNIPANSLCQRRSRWRVDRTFCIRIHPRRRYWPVGIATIGIVGGEVGGSTTDVRSEELSRTILEFSA